MVKRGLLQTLSLTIKQIILQHCKELFHWGSGTFSETKLLVKQPECEQNSFRTRNVNLREHLCKITQSTQRRMSLKLCGDSLHLLLLFNMILTIINLFSPLKQCDTRGKHEIAYTHYHLVSLLVSQRQALKIADDSVTLWSLHKQCLANCVLF